MAAFAFYEAEVSCQHCFYSAMFCFGSFPLRPSTPYDLAHHGLCSPSRPTALTRQQALQTAASDADASSAEVERLRAEGTRLDRHLEEARGALTLLQQRRQAVSTIV